MGKAGNIVLKVNVDVSILNGVFEKTFSNFITFLTKIFTSAILLESFYSKFDSIKKKLLGICRLG
jgi:hypothetical protein